jgi:hypothetical protein
LKAVDPQTAKSVLLHGSQVKDRAIELMDLNRFTSLEEFKKSGGKN